MISTLKEVRDALEDLKRQYGEHPDAFWDWTKARAATTKLDALIAQRAAGDDGLAQQYTKLSAHCAMLEDKLATLTNAIGAKQMADFVAKHGAQEKAEPVATVAEVHMSRYTIEWTNGPLHEGTKLFTAPQPALSTSQPTECKVICELCKKRGYNFCANVAKTTPINLQAAPSTSQTLTDIDIAAAIEVADAKWADADVPLEWVAHFARAIEAKIGAKP